MYAYLVSQSTLGNPLYVCLCSKIANKHAKKLKRQLKKDGDNSFVYIRRMKITEE